MAAPRKTRLKSPAAALNIPQSREMAAQAIAEIGIANRELTRLNADMNDELALVKERWEALAQPIRQQAEATCAGLQIYAEANRAALTNNYKVKSCTFTTGEVSWRLNPPSVRLTDTEENVIAACEAAGLVEFVRYTPTVNRDAIKANPDEASHVPGIKIGQSEAFIVVPFEAELAEVA